MYNNIIFSSRLLLFILIPLAINVLSMYFIIYFAVKKAMTITIKDAVDYYSKDIKEYIDIQLKNNNSDVDETLF